MKKGPGPRGSRDEEFLVPSLIETLLPFEIVPTLSKWRIWHPILLNLQLMGSFLVVNNFLVTEHTYGLTGLPQGQFLFFLKQILQMAWLSYPVHL